MQTEPIPYYLDKIREVYFDKQKVNPSFSLRSYARFLGVQAPSLSSILRNKRGLPVKLADQVMEKLSLSPLEKRRFRDSLYERVNSNNEPKVAATESNAHVLHAEENYKIISEWEHFSIIFLLGLQGAKSDPAWIGQRLGITPLRVEDCLQRLISAGLLKRSKSKKLVPTHENISTTEDISSGALRKSHADGLVRANTALEAIALELRDFSSVTLAMDLNKITEAKNLIRSFRKQMAALVENPSSTEVYELAIQLFPVTKS